MNRRALAVIAAYAVAVVVVELVLVTLDVSSRARGWVSSALIAACGFTVTLVIKRQERHMRDNCESAAADPPRRVQRRKLRIR